MLKLTNQKTVRRILRAGFLLANVNDCINLLARKREAILVKKGGGQCKIDNGCLLGLEEKIVLHKLLSKHHDVMYKKLAVG